MAKKRRGGVDWKGTEDAIPFAHWERIAQLTTTIVYNSLVFFISFVLLLLLLLLLLFVCCLGCKRLCITTATQRLCMIPNHREKTPQLNYNILFESLRDGFSLPSTKSRVLHSVSERRGGKKRKTARSRDHEEQQIKRLDLSSTPLKIQARNNILQIHTPSFDNSHALPFPCTTPSRPFFFFFPLTPQSCNLVA